jgi:hypothetical protein
MEVAIKDPIQGSNDPRYTDGLVKLRTLEALHGHLDAEPQSHAVPVHSDPPIQKNSESVLIEKCRNRAFAEYHDHEVKAEAFLMLSERYKALGLDAQANAYNDQARLECATTRGFQSVVKAYDKKLEDLGFHGAANKAGSLEAARQHLERYDRDRRAFEEHTLGVEKAEETLRTLEPKLVDRTATSAERKQFQEALYQRSRFERMAERDALNDAQSYKSFGLEIQSVEKSYDAFSHSTRDDLEKTGIENSQTNSQRMNKLSLGVIVCQTLKVIDHEL